jgi:uncharacterized protein (DUF2267 family)
MSTSMDVTEFLALVEQEGDLDPPEAVRAVQATLETLGERISGGESDDLAAELPEPLRHLVRSDGNAEAFDFDEFLRRVAERESTEWRAPSGTSAWCSRRSHARSAPKS